MDIDTSTYPKLPANPPSVLDTVGKLQGLQQGQQAIQSNAIQIDKQQYDLVASKWAGISKQMPGLIKDPNLTQDKIQQLYQNNVRDGLMTPDMAASATSQIPPTAGMQPKEAVATLQQHLAQRMQQGQTMMEALEMHLPKPTTMDTGNQQVPVTVSRLPGQGIRQIQPGIPTQLPVGTEQNAPAGATDAQGNPVQQGTPGRMGPVAPGTLSGLPVAGAGSIFPFKPGTAPPQIMGTGGVPTAGAPKAVPTQSFVPTGNPPMFEEGKKQLAADQDMATQRLTAIKQAQQALPLMEGIMSGPTTGTFTNALATAKAYGIIPTSVNDPVLARQMVLKKLNAYVATSPLAGRSDAGLLQTEASSPNPNIQNLPALKKLTQDAIALDRVQAARAGAFTKTVKGPVDANGKPTQVQVPDDDLSKYPTHRSTFPAQVDERAFGLDNMDPKDRDELMATMTKGLNRKDKNGKPNPTFEAKKFFKSLSIVDQQGLIDTGAGQ